MRFAGEATPVVAAFVLGLFLRVYLILVTPIGGPSYPGRVSSYDDELAHVAYIDYVHRSGSLPAQVGSIQDKSASTHPRYENYQPPMYYAAVSSIGHLFDLNGVSSLCMAGRWFNLLLFTILFPILVMILRIAGSGLADVRNGLIFLSLNGVLLRFSVTASNDMLFWLFAGGMIWTAMLLAGQRQWSSVYLALFAGFLVAGLYTKLSSLLFAPLPLLMLARNMRRGPIVQVLVMYASVAILTGPLWYRNVHEFGSLVPLSAGFGNPKLAIPGFVSALYFVRSFVFPWSEFWRGWVGLLLMLPALGLMIWSALRRDTWRKLLTHPVLLSSLCIVAVAFVWLNFHYRQSEARYLFAAWPSVAVLVSKSWLGSTLGQWTFLLSLILPYGLFLISSPGI
jgi:hypothetical protein